MVQDYIRGMLKQHGYQEVHTPQVIDRSLWEKSGHWDKFGDMIFTTHSENRDYAIKPMNCPAHIQIYNHGLKSYRDLPLRLAEFGSCHRNEPSGTLHGLMRVRNFVQDDAHIFCTEEQILPEVLAFSDLLFEVYRDFGFEDVMVELSTRPERRVGDDSLWDRAEEGLAAVLAEAGADVAIVGRDRAGRDRIALDLIALAQRGPQRGEIACALPLAQAIEGHVGEAAGGRAQQAGQGQSAPEQRAIGPVGSKRSSDTGGMMPK